MPHHPFVEQAIIALDPKCLITRTRIIGHRVELYLENGQVLSYVIVPSDISACDANGETTAEIKSSAAVCHVEPPDSLNRMTMAELRSYAKQHGIQTRARATRKEILRKLCHAQTSTFGEEGHERLE